MAQPVVSTRRDGNIAVLIIDNPPVNASSQAVRQELLAAISRVAADRGLAGLVIACAGSTFVAGEDIDELGKLLTPTLTEVISALETCGKPSVAALHGTTLGGGFELALGCTWRVATADARVGLLDVRLGLLPSAGGTLRGTYLCGGMAALGQLTGGQTIPASEAMALGLVDSVDHDIPVGLGIAYLRDRIAAGDRPLPVSARRDAMPPCDLAAFDAAAARIVARARSVTTGGVVTAIRNALTLPTDQALREERAMFLAAVDSPVSAARRHLFLAERKAARLPPDASESVARSLKQVGVVGAGTMGRGIAMAFANAGYAVHLTDTTAEALDQGLTRIADTYRTAVARGKLAATEGDARLARITSCPAIDGMDSCDLIVEAAFEDMVVKRAVFAEMDRIARPGAILATNTSYLDVNAIAASTRRPADVLGLHFFSPAHVMSLLEVVRGAATAPDVLATALSTARAMGKQPVIVGVGPGFVGNRMLAARNAQLGALLLEGADPQAVDAAFRDFGWLMGPFEMQDMAGLDISWRNRRALGTVEPVADALCEAGRLGQKVGAGWYSYSRGLRTPLPDPAVQALIDRLAAERGIVGRKVDAAEIIARTHVPMVAEGAALLREGIAATASDIDVIWTHGYGFPADLGGPMFWAQNAPASHLARSLAKALAGGGPAT